MNDRLKTLSRGIIDVSPLMIPVVPFGIIYGVIGMELGLGAYMTFGMSIIIFGGASQIVLLQLFSGGASSLVAITSVGAVNSRHLLYGAVFSEYADWSRQWNGGSTTHSGLGKPSETDDLS